LALRKRRATPPHPGGKEVREGSEGEKGRALISVSLPSRRKQVPPPCSPAVYSRLLCVPEGEMGCAG
jgi:hypothetical protein